VDRRSSSNDTGTSRRSIPAHTAKPALALGAIRGERIPSRPATNRSARLGGAVGGTAGGAGVVGALITGAGSGLGSGGATGGSGGSSIGSGPYIFGSRRNASGERARHLADQRGALPRGLLGGLAPDHLAVVVVEREQALQRVLLAGDRRDHAKRRGLDEGIHPMRRANSARSSDSGGQPCGATYSRRAGMESGGSAALAREPASCPTRVTSSTASPLPVRIAPTVQQHPASVIPLFAAAFVRYAAVAPWTAVAFCGVAIRFQRGALVVPFFAACSPGTATGDPLFDEVVVGVALAFQG
jgi:hypothetical protein